MKLYLQKDGGDRKGFRNAKGGGRFFGSFNTGA